MRWRRTFELPERALRPEASQGPDEDDGNPVHLLRHSHSKRGAAGRQDRAESTAGGLLKRKYTHRKCFQGGTAPLSLRMDKKSGRNDRIEI